MKRYNGTTDPEGGTDGMAHHQHPFGSTTVWRPSSALLSYIYHTIIIYSLPQVSTIQINDRRHKQSGQVLLVTQSTGSSSIRQP